MPSLEAIRVGKSFLIGKFNILLLTMGKTNQ
jgi:hypothetical protein